MEVQELTKPVEPRKKQQRGWMVAAAAFASVVVVIGAAMFLAGPSDDLPPATTPPTTQAVTPTTQAAPPTTQAVIPTTVAAVAEAEPVMTGETEAILSMYEEAFANGDAVAFRALFNEGARRVDQQNPGLNVSLDQMVDEMSWLNVQHSMLEIMIDECVATSYGARCDFVYSGPVETAMYGLPIDMSYGLTIENGRISEISERCDLIACRPQLDVIEWVQERYGVNLVDRWPVLAGDQAELWLEYAPLWAEAGRP